MLDDIFMVTVGFVGDTLTDTKAMDLLLSPLVCASLLIQPADGECKTGDLLTPVYCMLALVVISTFLADAIWKSRDNHDDKLRPAMRTLVVMSLCAVRTASYCRTPNRDRVCYSVILLLFGFKISNGIAS